MTSYCIEYAKSNRAACKVCKCKIEKDALRIGTIAPGPGDFDMCSWRHLACQKMPKGLTSVSELSGLLALTAEDRAKVETWFAEGGAAAAKKSAGTKRRVDDANADGSAGASSSSDAAAVVGDPKKMKIGELKAACAAHGLSTTGKKGELAESLEEVAKRQALEAKYEKMSGVALKEMLALNVQIKSGTKSDLVERCVDGALYGALPRCPLCGGGTLRVHYASRFGHGGKGTFGCPGYYDDDQFVRCKFSGSDVARLAWKEVDANSSGAV